MTLTALPQMYTPAALEPTPAELRGGRARVMRVLLANPNLPVDEISDNLHFLSGLHVPVESTDDSLAALIRFGEVEEEHGRFRLTDWGRRVALMGPPSGLELVNAKSARDF